jgi:hypothetical integral membrane protein (TIGR02206 family)
MGWFDESLKVFSIFSLSHGLTLVFFGLTLVGMLVFRNFFPLHPRWMRGIEIGAAILMLFLQTIFYAWTFAMGQATWDLLPFGVCHISMYVTSFALLFQWEKGFRFIFPWAVMGAILSLVIADLEYEFPHFRYFHYFFNHGVFLLANLWFVVVRKWTFPYRSLWKSGAVLFLMSMAMLIINPWFGTNHLFMDHLPEPAQPLFSWLGDPGWKIGFILSVILMFHIVYGIYLLLRKLDSKKVPISAE